MSPRTNHNSFLDFVNDLYLKIFKKVENQHFSLPQKHFFLETTLKKNKISFVLKKKQFIHLPFYK